MTLYIITTLTGHLLPVVPQRFRTLAILEAIRHGYETFKVKEIG